MSTLCSGTASKFEFSSPAVRPCCRKGNADFFVQNPGQDQRVKGGNDTHGVDDHITTFNVLYALYKSNYGITSKVGKQLRGLASHVRIERRRTLQHCKELFAQLISARQRQAGCLVQDPEPIERSPLCHRHPSEAIRWPSDRIREVPCWWPGHFGPARALSSSQNYLGTFVPQDSGWLNEDFARLLRKGVVQSVHSSVIAA